ncbi:MFS transporter [Lentilactobacillus sp. Marseille-Q4993]|uniref:MFS transporter n=1 Tax=Lentilactobacillus sp. Marseille-Q4993 TaxID=3039492 RepID=UPI0024BBF6C4|nr:MFS transporter [Lentilactobacillus sp. Marseille-Q4993]
MKSRNSLLTKAAFLSVSLLLTSAYAIQGALPQLKAALGVSQTQVEYLATVPSFAVTIFVILSPIISQAFKLSDKRMIQIGLTIVGIAGIIPFFISNYWVILASRLILGVGLGIYNSQAIALISIWYDGNTRSQMLGWRAAAEQLGQAGTLLVAGSLLMFGWHTPFLVYALAFAALAFFSLRVPDDNEEEVVEETADVDDAPIATDNYPSKINPAVWLLVAFAFFLVVDFVGMENRFSSLAVAINGNGYSGASMFLSLMLVGATLGGMTYGWFQKAFGFATVYIGLVLMAISSFMFGFAGTNFTVMVVGLLLIGFPLQLVSPFIFNLLPKFAPLKQQSLVTSLVLIGFNLGSFLSPSMAALINSVFGKPSEGLSLAVPFPVYGAILLLIAVGIFFSQKAASSKQKTSEEK